MDRTTSGRVRLRISLQPSWPSKSPRVAGLAWSMVPMAPSATTTRWASAARSSPAACPGGRSLAVIGPRLYWSGRRAGRLDSRAAGQGTQRSCPSRNVEADLPRGEPGPRGRRWWVIELDGIGKLTSPVIIAAFEGWNDAGEAASGVINHLSLAWQATPVGA